MNCKNYKHSKKCMSVKIWNEPKMPTDFKNDAMQRKTFLKKFKIIPKYFEIKMMTY